MKRDTARYAGGVSFRTLALSIDRSYKLKNAYGEGSKGVFILLSIGGAPGAHAFQGILVMPGNCCVVALKNRDKKNLFGILAHAANRGRKCLALFGGRCCDFEFGSCHDHFPVGKHTRMKNEAAAFQQEVNIFSISACCLRFYNQ